MLCPNCSATCLAEDGSCHNCHRPLPTGLRQSTVVSWSCGIGAILGTLLVFLVAPFSSGVGLAATLCVAIPFAFGGACVAGLMGWIIGRLACEH
jgi:hypothetical protein